MQEAIPYRTWSWATGMTDQPRLEEVKAEVGGDGGGGGERGSTERVLSLAAENAVLVVGRKGCCMCHVVRRLLQALGANPLVYEVEDERELAGVGDGEGVQFPAVFIGGKIVGGLEWLMAAHISGELVPILKKAGALWL